MLVIGRKVRQVTLPLGKLNIPLLIILNQPAQFLIGGWQMVEMMTINGR